MMRAISSFHACSLLRYQAFKASSLASRSSYATRPPLALKAKPSFPREGVDQISVRVPSKIFSSRLASDTTVDDSEMQSDPSAAHPSDLKLRDKMSHAYGDDYATRSSDDGFGERYGEPMDVFRKDDTNENMKAIPDQLKEDSKSSEDKQLPGSGNTFSEQGHKENPKDAVGLKTKLS